MEKNTSMKELIKILPKMYQTGEIIKDNDLVFKTGEERSFAAFVKSWCNEYGKVEGNEDRYSINPQALGALFVITSKSINHLNKLKLNKYIDYKLYDEELDFIFGEIIGCLTSDEFTDRIKGLNQYSLVYDLYTLFEEKLSMSVDRDCINKKYREQYLKDFINRSGVTAEELLIKEYKNSSNSKNHKDLIMCLMEEANIKKPVKKDIPAFVRDLRANGMTRVLIKKYKGL